MPHNAHDTNNPVIYVFFGMIATGKSTISQAWAWQKQLRCYNSDWVRKEMAGINPTESQRESVDTGIYTKEFSQKTYKILLERAEARIKQGDSVILDASYQYTQDRQDVKELANDLNCQVYFILCQCPEAEMKRRMDTREKDSAAISDGRWEIYQKQKKRFQAPDELSDSELIILDTQVSLEELLKDLEEKLP
ncbi:MAG: ATP-binding protein [Desulfobulbaceae bacterium]|nr:ATP-binding protein [Desulfobulbaceae bacterium]